MIASVPIDWSTMFVPSVHPVEIFLRGSAVYLFIFTALRIFRRQAGAIATSDLLVIVLIADAAQNAMASDYKSITDGLLLVATILFWNYALDWLGFRFPRLRPLLEPGPLLLIQNGRMQQVNLRKEMLTEDELLEQLREHGVESPDQVKLCYLEGDGHISVIELDSESKQEDPRKRVM